MPVFETTTKHEQFVSRIMHVSGHRDTATKQRTVEYCTSTQYFKHHQPTTSDKHDTRATEKDWTRQTNNREEKQRQANKREKCDVVLRKEPDPTLLLDW